MISINIFNWFDGKINRFCVDYSCRKTQNITALIKVTAFNDIYTAEYIK